MSMHDANPGDVYADAHGKLWRVISVYHEPTVTVEEIEPLSIDGVTSSERARRGGGVSGYMWNGYKRIFRPEPKQQ